MRVVVTGLVTVVVKGAVVGMVLTMVPGGSRGYGDGGGGGDAHGVSANVGDGDGDTSRMT